MKTSSLFNVVISSLDLGNSGCDLSDTDDFLDDIKRFSVGLTIIGIIMFTTSCIMVITLNIAAENQVHQCQNWSSIVDKNAPSKFNHPLDLPHQEVVLHVGDATGHRLVRHSPDQRFCLQVRKMNM